MYEISIIDGIVYGRINKRQARKLYKSEEVYMLPCNMNFSNIIINPAILRKDRDFDLQVNAYQYYNCNYETGYYTHFWLRMI